ncbi:MAG: hypothetical protein KBC73_23115 [Burkholderiaceae bacterium]|nr:hypothetical protein [Burkholderiaceae bacterium]
MPPPAPRPAPARPGRLAILVLACSALLLPPAPAAAEGGKRLAVQRLAEADAPVGIFDPSFADDGRGRLWMSYSTVVADKTHGIKFNSINTRLAVSGDGGKTWEDQGLVNAARDQALPWPHNKLAARWEYEVSRLQRDPWASEATRWKLLSHRYLRVYDGKGPDSVPLFEHGWIELRTAAEPRGPWSEPRKLFVGSVYNKNNDNTIGPPEMRLDQQHKALAKCPAFTEPGMLAREEGLYVALTCPTRKDNGEVALLRCDHELGRCDYRGALLRDADARKLGGGVSGFSGTDLIERDGQAFVVATPTKQPGDTYHGCAFYRISSLDPAQVQAEPALRVSGPAGSFNGACGYAGAAGVFLSQYTPAEAQKFQIHITGQQPR